MTQIEAINRITRIRDLADGSPVELVLLVRDSQIRQTRAGADFMRLTLADTSGTVTGIIWDDAIPAGSKPCAGDPVCVIGTFNDHPRYGAQITVRELAPAEAVDWDLLVDGPATPLRELERQLDELLATIRNPALATLMTALLGRQTLRGRTFRRAFAAQYNHHAYRGGLLEHSLQVACVVDAAAMILDGIDRDLAVCGALLHDIGKLDVYSGDEYTVELNDAGKLIGEIPSGYYAVRCCIEDIPDFPPDLAQALLHIILSHHGCLEHGSPVLPVTREALLVHTMDKLSGDLGSFDRVERETANDHRWSRYDRALGHAVFLGERARAAS